MAGSWPAPRWRTWEVDWSNATCTAPRCISRPDLLYDTDRDGRGYLLCADCADLLLDRELGLDLAWSLGGPEGRRRSLALRPPLWE